MTSQVKITAHCAAHKQVRISIKDGDRPKETIYLNDGQEREFSVYDNLEISVKEREVELAAAAMSDGNGGTPTKPPTP